MAGVLLFKRSRHGTSRLLLMLFLVGSLGQYFLTGQVTWMTDSLRWMERSARSYADLDAVRREVSGWAAEAGRAGRRVTGDWHPGDWLPGDWIADMAALVTPRTSPLPEEQAPPLTVPVDLTGRVVRIADGDTLTLLDSQHRQHRIRLYGIDTPERSQAYGSAARAALDAMVAGREIGVQVKETDRYGRTVGVVFVDQRNVNLALVKEGWAWWYERYAPGDTLLESAQREARSAHRGLWQDRAPVPPWEWRRKG